MRRCPLCGFEAGDAEPFCALCGAAMGPPGAGAAPAGRRGYVELPGGERIEVTDEPSAVGREALRPYAGGQGAERISRAHFTVVRRGGRFMIEDGPGPAQPKASANGTWVKARAGGAEERLRAGAPVELGGGEAIDVARVVALRFVVEGA